MTTAAISSPRGGDGGSDLVARLRGIAAGAGRLGERLARARRAAATAPDTPDLAPLAGWARAYALGDADALRQRLAWDDLTPELAAAALGPAGEPGPLDPLPAWLAQATAFLGLGSDLRGGAPALDLSDLPFAELWQPWVERALAALGADGRGATIPARSRARLAYGLAQELARIGGLAAHAALSATAAKDAASGRYRRFVDDTLAAGLLPLYERFPVLLRQSWTLVESWRDGLLELAERHTTDRGALEERFGAAGQEGVRLGGLVEVERLASDRHEGGRGVFRLAFEHGANIVYKPRSLAAEGGYERWLARLAAAGLADLPPAPAVLERPGYGWMAWVEPTPLADRGQAARWFRRAGTLVALAEAAGAEDLHAENLVATAAGPAVVDGEMLLQPARAGGAAGASFAAGLLRPVAAPTIASPVGPASIPRPRG